MDKNIKSFIYLSAFTLSLLGALLLIFIYFYKYSTINTYNFILLVLISLTIIIALLFAITGSVFYHTYQKKKVSASLNWALVLGLKVTMPIVISISKLINNNDKDLLRRFYIDVNNIYVGAKEIRYNPEDILVILPHCLQNAQCSFKVTHDENLCIRCGKCNIGTILDLVRKKGVKIKIVTGGTAARSIIKSLRPKFILSVACERDLMSGISDVGNLPVMGIINERPNGPCFNTFVNTEELEQKLDTLLKKGG